MPSAPYTCPSCGAPSRRKPPSDCKVCGLPASQTLLSENVLILFFAPDQGDPGKSRGHNLQKDRKVQKGSRWQQKCSSSSRKRPSWFDEHTELPRPTPKAPIREDCDPVFGIWIPHALLSPPGGGYWFQGSHFAACVACPFAIGSLCP